MPPTTSAHNPASDRQPTRRAIVRGLAGAASAAFLSAGWAVEAAVPRINLDAVSAPALPLPVKLVFVFGHPESSEHFEGYYRTVHVPLALKMPNFLSLESALAVGDADGGNASFYRIAILSFASEDEMATCLSSEAGQAAIADVSNFATGGVTATVVTNIQARQGAASAVGPSTEFTVPQRYEQRRID